MNHKIKSTVTIVAVLFLMFGIGIMINSPGNSITGAAVLNEEGCACSVDADCDDGDPCTADICLYAELCEASLCINNEMDLCLE